MPRSYWIFLTVLAAALLTATGSRHTCAASETGKVVIGLLLPPEEAEAASLRAGVQLAVEHANQAHTSSVALVIRGRAGQWGADGVEAARMVLDDGAQGLIAPPSGAATHLALQVAGRTAVPVISLCADSSVSQTGVPWMVRIASTTIEEARLLLTDPNSGTSGPPQWAALVPDGRAGREIARDLRQAASTAQAKLTSVCEVNSNVINFESVAAQALKDRPSAVLVWLDPVPAGKLARSLRDAGFAGKLAGPSRCNSASFLDASAQASEGFLVPAMVLDKDDEACSQPFRTAFRQRYGIEANLTAAEGYDAVRLLVRILQTSDPQSLPRAFPLTFSLPGASGNLSFDDQGNRKVALRLLVARGGRFVAVEHGQK